MHVYIIKNKITGQIEAVSRTIANAGLKLFGYGNASFADGQPFTLATIEAKMMQASEIEVSYDDGTILVLEHHALEG